MPEFRRQNIRLPTEAYRGQRRYLLTLCFYKRRRFGADPRIARWLADGIRKHSTACEFLVHAYSVMPDHVHIFAEGASAESNMVKFAEAFKQQTAVEFARRHGGELWQFKYYDHVLRRADSFDRVAWYVWMNPVRAGLCRAPADYPFSGAMTPGMQKLFRGSSAVEWLPPWKAKAKIERKK